MHEQVRILTKEGECPAHVFTPEGEGTWPPAIFYMDAFGIRPTLFDMAQRLADAGYVVLLPDMFYRYGSYGPLVPKEAFAGDFRATIGPLVATINNHKAAEDTEAFIIYLDSRADVLKPKIGVTGLCMGGSMAITAAGFYPERIAAVASFHAGNVATDADTSPHRVASGIAAELYIAGADNDASYPPDMAARFATALGDAGVQFRAEIYEGAAHGWMKPDFPVYNEAAAERGWEELLALFGRVLKAPGVNSHDGQTV